MSSTSTNEDLRSIKTKRALYTAMFSLLKNLSFRQLTIKGICEEALISRAAFYAHFIDKYDLLQHWLKDLSLEEILETDNYEQIEKIINNHVHENNLVIKNLIYDADNETIEILFNCILSIIKLSIDKNHDEEKFIKSVVLANFYAGGIISYLQWQVKHNFPSEITLMNKYFYKLIREFQELQQNN